MLFTRDRHDLFVIVPGRPTGLITVQDIRLRGLGLLLGSTESVRVEQRGGDTVLTAPFSGGFAPVIRVVVGAS
ncbi:hypothetical protein ACWDT6_25810 [Nocardia grenadensis]|uniref:hypothetical protein n=1 Tax=Nocardia grenadensis TaxID=931537 RepID=UPI003D76364C